MLTWLKTNGIRGALRARAKGPGRQFLSTLEGYIILARLMSRGFSGIRI